ncbi:MAG: SNF2-related protein [Candidatus Aerophobetes bacterium]|nr:SNF2-related protein [Candidatus Aerophobetes bacterium]
MKKRKKRKEKKKREELSYLRFKARELYYEAEDALRRRKKNLAINSLLRAIRIDPEFWEAHLFLGFLYNSEREYNEALKFLLRAKEMAPERKEIYYNLGFVYANLKMFKEALDSYRSLISFLKRKGRGLNKDDKELKREVEQQISELEFLLKERREMETSRPFQEKPFLPPQKKEGELKKAEKPKISLEGLLAQLKVSKRFTFRKNRALLEKLKQEDYEPLRLYQIRIQSSEFSLIKGFDRLLCLSQIKETKRLWYQIETAKKTLKYFRGRVLLCDEVGLGKTIEAGMILKEYLIRGLAKKVLILVPPSLVIQWKDEMASKFNLKSATTDDRDYQEEKEKFWGKNNLIIASLNIAKSKKNFEIITRIDYDMIIVDEAHHLKNRNTLNWKFVNSLKKKFILLLTATPVHNNLMELYNLITLLKPGQLKTPSSFRRSFVLRGDPRIPINREKFRELLSEVMIRNTRSLANINLPKRYATTIKIKMDGGERLFYEILSNFIKESYLSHKLDKFSATLLQMEIGSSPFAVRSTLSKLRERRGFSFQNIDKIEEILHSFDTQGSKKADKLIEILSKSNEKIIVFTNYIKTQKFLADKLNQAEIEYSLFNGRLSIKEKEASIKSFQEKKKVLISTEIGGEGKNLHFCNTMVNYDLPWNPMRIEQRIGRLHRIGQTRDVFIFNLSTEETVEDYLLDILDKKINMFELVLGEMDMILGNLDDSRNFPEIIMDIWTNAQDRERRKREFEKLGEELLEAKKRYLQIKSYDEEILEHDYEL